MTFAQVYDNVITDCGESWKRFWGLFLPWFSLSLSMFFLFGDKPLTRFPVMLCLYLTFIPPSASLPFPPPLPLPGVIYSPRIFSLMATRSVRLL